MLALSAATPVYLAVGATDLRKGFDGLHGPVCVGWVRTPRSGEVFVFCNRRRDTVKLLCWEDDGRWVALRHFCLAIAAASSGWPCSACWGTRPPATTNAPCRRQLHFPVLTWGL